MNTKILLLLTLAPLSAFAHSTPPPDEDDTVILTPFEVGVTAGGAKDARYIRDSVRRGVLPHPNTLKAEGFFSEHDLPLRHGQQGNGLLLVGAEAVPAKLLLHPEVKYVAQIGFSSKLNTASWTRAPINLVAVVDKSGSMSGQPLELVKSCLKTIVSHLGPEDQLSIVLYGDRSHVHLEPTSAAAGNRRTLLSAIDAITSAGSTNMEEGLKVGYALALQSAQGFPGTTRVMQFTDERPNVGDTSPEGFMALMHSASLEGIGQTTIGVGVQFGAELAAKVSTVRGGNLYYFADLEEVARTFDEDFDTLVSEIAHDVEVTLSPGAGLRIVDVYGVPGDKVQRHANGEISINIATLFLSTRRGALYVAYAPTSAGQMGPRRSLGLARLTYTEAGAEAASSTEVEVKLLPVRKAGKGLTRGVHLVNTYQSLHAAMTAHYFDNDQSKALSLIKAVDQQLATTHDHSLRKEKELVRDVRKTLAQLSGHASNSSCATPDEDEVVLAHGCFDALPE